MTSCDHGSSAVELPTRVMLSPADVAMFSVDIRIEAADGADDLGALPAPRLGRVTMLAVAPLPTLHVGSVESLDPSRSHRQATALAEEAGASGDEYAVGHRRRTIRRGSRSATVASRFA